ncbi:unnamed protein product [Prunus brigantina]
MASLHRELDDGHKIKGIRGCRTFGGLGEVPERWDHLTLELLEPQRCLAHSGKLAESASQHLNSQTDVEERRLRQAMYGREVGPAGGRGEGGGRGDRVVYLGLFMRRPPPRLSARTTTIA